MDRESMTNEENYCFDVAGHLIVRGALTPKEVETLNRTLDKGGRTEGMLAWPASLREPFRDLMVHPILVWYLNQIIGPGFRLDRPPRLIGDTAGDAIGPLTGGDEPRDPARAYYHQNGYRSCQGVRAIWALSDVNAGDGGFVLIPCSHKGNVETPGDILTGKDDLGLTLQPVLKAGDLLLCAETLLHGLRPWRSKAPQRLLTYWYAGRAAIQSNGPEAPEAPSPEWMNELTPAERAVLHRPGHKGSDPSPTLNTDGKTCWVEKESRVIHPSIYVRDPNSTIDEKEFYFWDLCGYLVVRNVMTPEDLKLANEAVDSFEDKIVVGEELARGSKSMAGTGRPLLSGLIELPRPYCEPFRKMIAHPAVVRRLTWMKGSGFRTGGGTAFCAVKGTSGHSLHDGNEPLSPSRGYVFKNGRSYAETVTVTWQLRDVTEKDGGFACVPGSHKAQYPMPPGVRSCDDDMGLVVHPVMKAGDVLFFMDGGMTHGALAWKNDIPRRGILIKYQSRNSNWGGGVVEPQDRWGDLVEGMTEEQLALMYGPTRDARARNIPRLVVKEGKVAVTYDAQGDPYALKVQKR
ncbi:phytanoyl-CoA dioxygenase family protein [bacterium]|nr:phytanoyl-CoA dioxygenase family protein [bacterium]